MEKHILFTEVQKQKQKWIWFLFIILTLTAVLGSVQQLLFEKPFGTHPMPDWGFLIVFGVLILCYYLLFRSKLYTEITSRSIQFRYKPFHREAKIIHWEQVNACYVRLYNPIKEFGGWGIRTTFTGKKGIAYNVSGNIGIQIEMKNGKRVLIGTRKPKEAEEVLKSIIKTK